MRKRTLYPGAILLASLLALGFVALRGDWPGLPAEWLPWTPLDIASPPNLWTRHKLSRLTHDPALCRAVLRTTAVEVEPLEDQVTGENCGFTNEHEGRSRFPAGGA